VAFSDFIFAFCFGALNTQFPIIVPKWLKIGPVTWTMESSARQLVRALCREKHCPSDVSMAP